MLSKMGIVRSKIPYESVDTDFHGINMENGVQNGMQMVHQKHFNKMSIRTSASERTTSAIGRQVQKAKDFIRTADTTWA